MVDGEGEVGKIHGRLLDVERRQVFQSRAGDGKALVVLEHVDPQFAAFLVYRVGEFGVVASPGIPVDVCVVEFYRARAHLADLAFQFLERALYARVLGVHSAAEQNALRMRLCEFVLRLNGGEALLVDVVEHDGLRHGHVCLGILEHQFAQLPTSPFLGEPADGVSARVNVFLAHRASCLADSQVPEAIEPAVRTGEVLIR